MWAPKTCCPFQSRKRAGRPQSSGQGPRSADTNSGFRVASHWAWRSLLFGNFFRRRCPMNLEFQFRLCMCIDPLSRDHNKFSGTACVSIPKIIFRCVWICIVLSQLINAIGSCAAASRRWATPRTKWGLAHATLALHDSAQLIYSRRVPSAPRPPAQGGSSKLAVDRFLRAHGFPKKRRCRGPTTCSRPACPTKVPPAPSQSTK